ncbi:MAG: hypothetical protein IPK80_23310 [Nannocystis sp.]|nr:hypothetical protein [Nannocystis sp.]
MSDPQRRRENERLEEASGGLRGLLRRGFKSAVARWAVRHRPHEASWPRAQDEATHAWDGRRHFSEDYTFVATQGDLAVVARIEWLPGRAAHRVWLVVFEAGAVYSLAGGQQVIRGAPEDDHWRAGGLTIDCGAPMQRWTVRFRGKLEALGAGGQAPESAARGSDEGAELRARIECRVDLTFSATAAPFVPGSDDDPELLSRLLGEAEWDTALLRGIQRRPLRSYVQTGAMVGSVALDARILAVSAAGLRQHSWGVRDWGASDQALQCFMAQGGAPLLWIHRAVFPWLTLEGGFVSEGEERAPVAAIGVTSARRPGHAPSHVGLAIAAGGEELSIEAATLAELRLEMDGRGEVVLAFLRGGGARPISGVWVEQRRLLPRPGPR